MNQLSEWLSLVSTYYSISVTCRKNAAKSPHRLKLICELWMNQILTFSITADFVSDIKPIIFKLFLVILFPCFPWICTVSPSYLALGPRSNLFCLCVVLPLTLEKTNLSTHQKPVYVCWWNLLKLTKKPHFLQPWIYIFLWLLLLLLFCQQ